MADPTDPKHLKLGNTSSGFKRKIMKVLKYLSTGNNNFSVLYYDILGYTSTFPDEVHCSSSSCYLIQS